jgi:mannosyltransferase
MHEIYAPFKSRILHNILKFLSLNSADVILCISESTKSDLKEIYPKIYSKKDIRVIENAASDVFYPDANSVQKTDFLWVAGRSGYKNFEYALKILGYLREHGKIYKLSVVGSELTDEEIKCAEHFGVLNQIDVYSNVSMDELRKMYSNALALLYLSKYEGFGLPILEAQKCLCPVVALKNPASIEVGKDSILYINNDSEQDISNIIEKLSDSQMRDKIVKDGLENSIRYDWNVSVKKLVNVYREYQC